MEITKVSYYLSSYDTHGMEINIYRILDSIKSGKFEKDIQAIRDCEEPKKRSKLKAGLKSFITAGVFVPTREMYNFTRLSGMMILDIDQHILVADPDNPKKKNKKKQYQDVTEIFKTVTDDKHTMAAFISPSGNGIKIIVRLGEVIHTVDDEVMKQGSVQECSDVAVEAYHSAFEYMRDVYQQKGIILDRSGKNINRICYVSSDPNLFIREDSSLVPSIVMHYKPKEIIVSPDAHTGEEADLFFKMELAIGFVDRHQQYGDGNRNNYVYELACTLNRFGVPMEDTLELVKLWYSLPATDRGTEWYRTIRSAYVGNRHQHGIKKVLVSKQREAVFNEKGIKSLRT